MLSRCSYRGLESTYHIGEGAYTKIPERSHALFPVAQFEFSWAHQIWNLTSSGDEYFQHYLRDTARGWTPWEADDVVDIYGERTLAAYAGN